MTLGDYVGIGVGLAISLILFYVGLRIGKRNRTKPLLRYYVDFDRLVRADDQILSEGIVVTQGGHKISSISRTCIALWNHQGDTINRADILPADPLAFILPATDRVIQARILACSRTQNGLEIKNSTDNGLLIDFEFLDSGDGAVVEIIHQGNKPVDVTGTVRGSTIERGGDTNLSSIKLALLASSGYWKRFRSYWFTKKRLARFTLLAVYPIGMLATFVTLWFQSRRRHPMLAPLDKYNLSTIQGQAAFARQVNQTGAQDLFPTLWIVTPLIAVAILLASWILFSSVRSLIPRSILMTPISGFVSAVARTTAPPDRAEAETSHEEPTAIDRQRSEPS